jgi:hypothetical protein
MSFFTNIGNAIAGGASTIGGGYGKLANDVTNTLGFTGSTNAQKINFVKIINLKKKKYYSENYTSTVLFPAIQRNINRKLLKTDIKQIINNIKGMPITPFYQSDAEVTKWLISYFSGLLRHGPSTQGGVEGMRENPLALEHFTGPKEVYLNGSGGPFYLIKLIEQKLNYRLTLGEKKSVISGILGMSDNMFIGSYEEINKRLSDYFAKIIQNKRLNSMYLVKK